MYYGVKYKIYLHCSNRAGWHGFVHLYARAWFISVVKVYRGFPKQLRGKESAYSAGAAGDMGLNPGSGRSPGGGRGNPLQCFCLENPMDRGDWWITVHGVAKSQTRLKRLSTHAHKVYRASTLCQGIVNVDITSTQNLLINFSGSI